jgi:hypothetical protein
LLQLNANVAIEAHLTNNTWAAYSCLLEWVPQAQAAPQKTMESSKARQ